MTNVEVFPKERRSEPHAITAWVLAVSLVLLCLWASHWQFERGTARHHRNAIISKHVGQRPISLESATSNLDSAEWREVKVVGKFETSNQILLRNKYFEGKYGFELLTLFSSNSSGTFWVDRGWIAPGGTATSQPLLPVTSIAEVSIVGRLRLDRSLPRGSFFAVPSGDGKLIEKWNAQSQPNLRTENFYIDLISSSLTEMNPQAPVQLPELTDGPHMAYALQWLFFGGLVIYGRILLRRGR